MDMPNFRLFRRGKPVRIGVAAMLVAGLSSLLSGCVYFNTFYNAEKAFEEAMRLKKERFGKNPEDTVLVSSDEKLKLERSIAKASKVLELYSDKTEYQPRALFLIGESFLEMGEYDKAVRKYDELARYYPNAEQVPLARFHRSKALFLDGQYTFAKPALEEIVNTSPNLRWRHEAMLYLAQLEASNDSPLAALELYEKLLAQENQPERTRANIRLEAAKLAFSLKQWERARKHALAAEISKLPDPLPLRAYLLAAQSLYEMGRYGDAVAELRALLEVKNNRSYRPEIQLPLAQALLADGKPAEAVELWLGVAKLSPKTVFAAEAFFLLGEHYLKNDRDEKKAKTFYDSSFAAGEFPPHTTKARDRSDALDRLAQLRSDTSKTATSPHYNDFMIAELFLFQLENLDSALSRLDFIVMDSTVDSVFGVRAAYARAFIHEEFKDSKPRADSLYRFVLEKYPGTEYAKQAERNMGLKPTVETDEDKAHALFLEAEKLRFDGEDALGVAVPAYRRVVESYPDTRAAARSQLNVAMLFEAGMQTDGLLLDSAKQAYIQLHDRYPSTRYGLVAKEKLSAAGISTSAAPASGKSPDSGKQPVDSSVDDDYGDDHHESYEEYGSESSPGKSEPEWQATPKEVLEGAQEDY